MEKPQNDGCGCEVKVRNQGQITDLCALCMNEKKLVVVMRLQNEHTLNGRHVGTDTRQSSVQGQTHLNILDKPETKNIQNHISSLDVNCITSSY